MIYNNKKGEEKGSPKNTIYSANVVLMLGWRLQQWPNFNPTSAECIVFAGDLCTNLHAGVKFYKTSNKYLFLISFDKHTES